MQQPSLNVAIFEDEVDTAKQIAQLLHKFAPTFHIVGHGKNIDECQALIRDHQIDLILSDIQLGPDVIFDSLPELVNFEGSIVFISGFNHFAVQSFELNAINYILKPIEEGAFEKMIARVEANLINKQTDQVQHMLQHLDEKTSGNKRISFFSKDGLVIKKLSDILYFKSDSNYTEVHFQNQEKLLITKTILHFEKLLNDYGFFRTHQSYLVNLQYLKLFNREECYVQLEDGKSIPVSHRKKSDLTQVLSNLVL